MRGLFEPVARVGDEVKEGELIGRVHPVEELDLSSAPVLAHCDGVVAIARRPPLVDLGDTLYHLAADTTPGASGASGSGR
ncbi:hypothetical protein [Streptomyces antnestii]|uniref:hypothetical protein n=1 Tax=Streptomyces antnestii TaxID=2494256 RepID=UPI0026886A3F